MTETSTPEVRKPREDTASARQRLYSAGKRNEALSTTLRTAREELGRIKEEARRLTEPPNSWGTLVALASDGLTGDVIVGGRRMRLTVGPEVEPKHLTPGSDVLLSEGLVIIGTGDFAAVGGVVTVREFVDDTRILVGAPGDDEQVYVLTQELIDSGLRLGDAVVVDSRTHYALEVVEKPEVSSLLLEEVPDITYSDIGGLADQIGQIQDAVELPFEHPRLYTEHGLKPPKGILLYGPPGAARRSSPRPWRTRWRRGPRPRRPGGRTSSTSRAPSRSTSTSVRRAAVRLIFARAREKASAGFPVVVFFDEMESLFRTRGTGKSSDVETTIVPRVTEIDGVEQLDNVIVIGASNREDLIDPAILRPGRLDVKIRIERPDAEAARDIFGKYLTAEPRPHPALVAEHGGPEPAVTALIDFCVERMYAATPENEFVEATYADGSREVLHFSDFASGAMIHNIVDRAKKGAIKSPLETGERGLHPEHFAEAIAEEFSEHEDLPNTTNPDEWARISGRKGERVTHLRMMHLDTTRGAPALESEIAEATPDSDLL